VRIRTLLVAVAGVLMVLASACSREAGPTPTGGGEDPGPSALATKLRAITQDVCYRAPGDIDPPECQKYVTQLGSVPGQARDYAKNEHPELTSAADTLGKGLRAYNSGGCGDDPGASGDTEACTQSLQDIADALGDVQAGVRQLPEVSG